MIRHPEEPQGIRDRGIRNAWPLPRSLARFRSRRDDAGAFDAARDAGPVAGSAVVEPERGGSDLADPPVEVRIDVTPLCRAWLAGTAENHGLVVMPVADRAVDEGESARFQVFASEHREVSYTPRLEVELEP